MKKISLILATILVLFTIGFAGIEDREEYCEMKCGAHFIPKTIEFILCVADCKRAS